MLFVLVNLAFFPFLWGGRSMMSAAAETSSIFPTGAEPRPAARIVAYKAFDPGTAAWQTEPEFVLEHKLLASGAPPIWNPFVGFGEPLAADMLAQPYYPLTWIVEAHPSPRAYNWYISLRLYVAALFAFLFLAYFVRFCAALGGAVAFSFSGYLVMYYDIAHLSVEVLIPALLWAVERVMRRRDWNAAGVLALVSAAVVFGGMPESALLAFAFATLFGAVRVIFDAELRAYRRAIVLRSAIGFALGAVVSSVLTLPFLEFVPLSFNEHVVSATGGAAVGWVNDTWDPRVMLTYLAPLAYGPPWNDIFNGFAGHSGIRGYWGVAAAYLACLAVAARVSERVRGQVAAWSPEGLFAVVAVVLLLKRFGVPPASLLGLLPGFKVLYFPKYDEAITAMCVATLAAFGIERLAGRRINGAAIGTATVVLLSVFTVCTGLVKRDFDALTVHKVYLLNAVAWGLVVLATVSALAWFSRHSEFATALAAAAAGIVTVDMLACFFVPMWYVINGEPPLAADPTRGAPFVAYVQRQTARNHERFLGVDGLLYPEWASAFGISDVRDLNALYAGDYLPFVRTFLAQNAGLQAALADRFTGGGIERVDDALTRRFLSLASVRYIGVPNGVVLSDAGAAATARGGFSTVWRDADAAIVRYDDALPRLAVYTRVAAAVDTTAALAWLALPQHDVHRVAVVTTSGPDATAAAMRLGNGAATPAGAGSLDRYDSRHVRGTVETARPALAVLNDTDFPGWRATVDGRPQAIVRANGLFRGVEVPAGRHVVEFTYEPRSFTVGLVLTLAGLAGALTLCFVPVTLSVRYPRTEPAS